MHPINLDTRHLVNNGGKYNGGKYNLSRETTLKPVKMISTLAPAQDITSTTRKECNDILAEAVEKQSNLPLLMITKSSISLYSWEDMKKISNPIRITKSDLKGIGSVNDPRMGVISFSIKCPYCSDIDCAGHYGLIDFKCPIYNPAFIREIVSVLICVCNDCSGLLITEDLMIQQGFMDVNYDKRLSAMETYCKDHECLRQKQQIGQGILIPCDKNPIFMTTDIKEKGEITYKRAEKGNRKINKEDPIKLMPINTVISILNLISDNDTKLLGFSQGSHPRNMIMMGCLVPPLIARPPVLIDGSMYHDQLTHMYATIVRKVENISLGKSGAVSELYSSFKQLIFKTDTKKLGMREFLSIVERLQGKTALLRGLLMGKRVDYCGRTVAGPDPSLKFGQIRLPESWAPILTKKVTVTNFNINNLQELFDDKKIIHIIPISTGLREYYGNRHQYKLHIGDKVERWLQNRDRVIVNRQPTLHRQSMMAYKVILGKPNTIGIHLSYTTPMNCDFDGDENNAWNPQDFEVEAEAEILLNVKNNIMSSEQNRPIMGLVMNSISATYLLTKHNYMVNNNLFAELLSLITDKDVLLTLHPRLLKYGVHPRSGQALFSSILPSDFYYRQKGVLILEGILISGRLKKSHVGASHRSIVQELYKNYGSLRTSDFLTDAPWILNKWLIERGFSVGILDMINLAIDEKTHEEYDKNEKILKEELAKIYVQIEALGLKSSDPIEEAFRTHQIGNLANIANGIGIRLANEILTSDNSIGVMTEKGAGTKGAVANIGQMMGAVGQQFYRGERLKPTITGNRRLLPTYDENDNNPEAHGFIPTSFLTGLSPESLFFLQAGGREGLLDTALKTAETGSMQHRMIKAFESIVGGYDGSIRNTIGTMFSPMYNSGYSIEEMMAVNYPGKQDFSSFIDIKNVVEELNVKRGWVPNNVNAAIINKRNKIDKDFVEDILPPAQPNFIKGPMLTDLKNIYGNKLPSNINNENPIIKITKFEKARIIGARATQLSNNDQPIIDIGNEIDPIKISLLEYETGEINIYIIRKFSDKTYQKIYPTLENI